MKKYMKIFLIVLIVFFTLCLFVFIVLSFSPWKILPTKSSSRTLTLVKDGAMLPNRITMRHYANDTPINDYILDLKVDLRSKQPQKYELPKIKEGWVEISIEMEDGITADKVCNIVMNPIQSNDLYENGLLIYLTTDYTSSTYIGDYVYYDQYTYFITGQEKICYFENAGTTEWVLTTNAPQLKKVTRTNYSYSPYPYGEWKKNKWIVLPIDNKQG